MSPKNSQVVVFVTKLREKAESLRARKATISEDAVKGLEEGLRRQNATIKLYSAGLRAYQSTNEAMQHIAANPTVRTMSARFVSNIVEDVASRINELASIIEAASKEPAVNDAVADVQTAMAEFSVVAQRFQEKMKTRKGPNLYAVKPSTSTEEFKLSKETHCQFCGEKSDMILETTRGHICAKCDFDPPSKDSHKSDSAS